MKQSFFVILTLIFSLGVSQVGLVKAIAGPVLCTSPNQLGCCAKLENTNNATNSEYFCNRCSNNYNYSRTWFYSFSGIPTDDASIDYSKAITYDCDFQRCTNETLPIDKCVPTPTSTPSFINATASCSDTDNEYKQPHMDISWRAMTPRTPSEFQRGEGLWTTLTDERTGVVIYHGWELGNRSDIWGGDWHNVVGNVRPRGSVLGLKLVPDGRDYSIKIYRGTAEDNVVPVLNSSQLLLQTTVRKVCNFPSISPSIPVNCVKNRSLPTFKTDYNGYKDFDGDFNCDGKVSGIDYVIWRNHGDGV